MSASARVPVPPLPHDVGFVEVADRVWLARAAFLDVNVGLVGGERGLLLVDTQTSEAAALRLLEEVRRLGAGDVVAAVNTHAHFDHTFGNVVVAEQYADVELLIHEEAAVELEPHAAEVRAAAAREVGEHAAEYAQVAASRVLVPRVTVSSARAVDLGDRLVEVLHPGRGHTAGDVVVRVPDADVLLAGDLVEESAARNGVPGFGEDCHPLDWPATLDLVVSMLGEQTLVLPGHGLPVDRDFVGEQRAAIGVVAETIRDLAGRGVCVDDALAAAEWPYPVEELGAAVRRGYAQLPRGARSLPLL